MRRIAVIAGIHIVLLTEHVLCYTMHTISHSVVRFHSTKLAVSSQDVNVDADLVSYVVARGDGSSGGGGVAMPKAASDDDGSGSSNLMRPKVGAEMPLGRPSWFHVPAPSQGTTN
jgi:hypothetical protein